MNVDSRLPVGIVALLIGVGIVAGTGAGTYVLQMTVAEPVEAEVVDGEVTTQPCSVDEACRRIYVPSVTYEFTYQGDTYTSSAVFPAGEHSRSEARSAAIVADYEPGEQVTAYVVPGLPETAYLRGAMPPVASSVLGLFGGLLTLGGVGGIVNSLRGKEPPENIAFE